MHNFPAMACQYQGHLTVIIVYYATPEHNIIYKGSKNVFHQNQYRCRDGAPDQVAAWKNQLAEKV